MLSKRTLLLVFLLMPLLIFARPQDDEVEDSGDDMSGGEVNSGGGDLAEPMALMVTADNPHSNGNS